MLRQMSQEELCYWIAYHNIENSDEESKKQKAAEQEQAKKDEALKLYQEIKKKYFQSMQYQNIDAYIERASAK